MKKHIAILIVILNSYICVTSAQELTKFEYELNEFRYSLYEYLDTVPFEQLQKMDFEAFKGLQEVSKQFIIQHEKEIQQYRLNILSQYKNITLPDLKNYQSKPFDDYIGEANSFLKDHLKEIKYIYDLYSFNPIILINYYTSAFFAQLDVKTLASESIKNQIASPRISTRKKDKTTWIVFADRNKYIFEFIYDFEDNFLYMQNIYEKKSLQPALSDQKE